MFYILHTICNARKAFRTDNKPFCQYDHIKENNPLKLTFCIILEVAKKKRFYVCFHLKRQPLKNSQSSQKATFGISKSNLRKTRDQMLPHRNINKKNNRFSRTPVHSHITHTHFLQCASRVALKGTTTKLKKG